MNKIKEGWGSSSGTAPFCLFRKLYAQSLWKTARSVFADEVLFVYRTTDLSHVTTLRVFLSELADANLPSLRNIFAFLEKDVWVLQILVENTDLSTSAGSFL